MPITTIKPGYQTTEFWQTLLTNLIAVLALFGVQVTTSDDVIHAVAVIAALLTSAIVTHSYTQGRSRVKVAQLHMPATGSAAPMSMPPALRMLPPV
jgi:hypothetical protein